MSKKEIEKVNEEELLRLKNADLVVEVHLLKLQKAETERNAILAGILRKHGFKIDAAVKLSDGVIEGEKEGNLGDSQS